MFVAERAKIRSARFWRVWEGVEKSVLVGLPVRKGKVGGIGVRGGVLTASGLSFPPERVKNYPLRGVFPGSPPGCVSDLFL